MLISYSNAGLRRAYYRMPSMARSWAAAAYSLSQHQNRFGGVFAEQLAELRSNAGRSIEAARADQMTRLRRMLVHSATHVPYYCRMFREIGFDPTTLRSVDDLSSIPLLDKETVRLQRELLIAQPRVQSAVSTHTSGTTGKGLHLLISQEAYQRSYACMWFHYAWAGISRGSPIATIAGHPVANPDSFKPPFWVYNPLEYEMLFSSQHLTPKVVPYYLDALAAFKPALIRGYPSSIYVIALALQTSRRSDIRPKAVITSSETLFDFQRQVIEQAFGCKAYSYYGNTERAAHILQCSEGMFHVVPEVCVVETIKSDGTPCKPGEEGELVCTSLIDKAMPLIRYRVGDTAIAAAGPCPCGLATPVLSNITGRVEDIVVTPDGRHVGRLDHAFKDALNVREAQIVQETIDTITVHIVPRAGYDETDRQAILDELRLRLGHRIRIEFRVVDRIERTKNGKLRFVISRVPIQIGEHKEVD